MSTPIRTYISVPLLSKKLDIQHQWRNYEWKDYYYKDLIQGLIKDHSVNEISSVISEELETLPKTIQKRMTKIEEKISLQFANPIKSGQSQGEMVYRVYSVGDM